MKKFTKVALSVLSLASVAAISIAGTVAYLTSTDADINVMTMGNVKIEQHEQQRDGKGGLEDFEQGQVLIPYVTEGATKKEALDVNGYEIQIRTKDSVANYMDKIVTVENTGNNNAYVRTIIAIPSALENEAASKNILHWNAVSNTDTTKNNGWYWGDKDKEWGENLCVKTVEIDEVKYNLYVATNVNKLAPGEKTAPSLVGVYLDSKVDFDGTTATYDGSKIEYDFTKGVTVLVATQAVQADGFSDAWSALDAAFGDVDADCFNTPTVAAPEPDAIRPAGYMPEGKDVVIDNLVVYDKSDEATNLRALYTGDGKKVNGDLTITSSYLDGTYAMNVIGDDTGVLTVENTALRGWVSYDGFTAASFTNCNFDVNSNAEFYKTLRPYSDIVLTDCAFAAGYEFWLDKMPADATITFKNCTIGGVAITDASQLNVVYEGGKIDIG